MIPLISIASGLLFGIIGVGYRVGSSGKVFPIQTVSALAFAGMFFFGILGRDAWALMPWQGYAVGVACGVTQYAAIRLLRKALELGPLSPAWCAASLGFMPAVIYAAVAMGERLSWMQCCAVAATILAIISSAAGQRGGAEGQGAKQKLCYGVLLVAILIFASIINILLKATTVMPGTQPGVTLLDECKFPIMAVIYVFLLLPSAMDLSLSRSWRFNRCFGWSGVMAAIGGIGGYSLQLPIMSAPAVLVFALSNSASILLAALTSTFLFHEKRTCAWYFTLSFSLLAILLNR